MAKSAPSSSARTIAGRLPPAQAQDLGPGGRREEDSSEDSPATPGDSDPSRDVAHLSLDELDAQEQEEQAKEAKDRADLDLLYGSRTGFRRDRKAADQNLARVKSIIERKERRLFTADEQEEANGRLAVEILQEEAPAEVPTTVLQQHLPDGAKVKAALAPYLKDKTVVASGTGLGTKYRFVGQDSVT